MTKVPSVRTKLPRAELLLFSTTIIWGSTFAVTKNALADFSPLLFQGVRFTIACLMVATFTWKHIVATDWDVIRKGSILGILLGTGFALQIIGLSITTASKGGFLTGTLVIFTPLLQMAIERKAPSIGNFIGVVLVCIGLYLLTSPAGSAFNFGDLLILLCAVVFSFHIVYVNVFTAKRFPPEIVFIQFAWTAAIGFALSPFLETPVAVFNTSTIWSLLYLSFFASAVALFIQAKYQRETTPARAAIIYTMEPVYSAVLAWLWLHEYLPSTAVIGAGVMVAGLLVSELWSFFIRKPAPVDPA